MTEPLIKGKLAAFNTIGEVEQGAANYIINNKMPLSGFLAGDRSGGWAVDGLEEVWEQKLKVRHAIAFNSATSALLAAAAAIELGSQAFYCPAFTMSATAVPRLLGARPVFIDCDPDYYTADKPRPGDQYGIHAYFVTNLFGHPARLHELRLWCATEKMYLIEDASQSPFAKEFGQYAGTVGHIGVFSLNVHKHIQCGEGGIAVTNDDDLADRMRLFRNHGEVAGSPQVSLNLRMTETTAAIGIAQMERADEIIEGRIQLAESLTRMCSALPGIRVPKVREGCTHSYYLWAFQVPHSRNTFLARMEAEGVPLVKGYVSPLYRMRAFRSFARGCPIAEDLHDKTLMYFPICAYSPTPEQVNQIGQAFEKHAVELFLHETSRA